MGGGICELTEQGLGGNYFQQQLQTRPVQLWGRATLRKHRTLSQSHPGQQIWGEHDHHRHKSRLIPFPGITER